MPRLTASILVLFLICFSTGCGQSKNTATASLRLIPPPGAIGPEGEFASLDSYYQTQIDLLCSDVILTEACADLKESQKTQQANSSDYRDRAADWQSRLSVTRNKDSQILKVFFEGESPQASREILDAILYAFVENTRQSEEESFSRKLHNLEQSLSMQAQLREKLSLDSQKSKPGLRENLADMYEQLYMDTQQKIAAMRFQTDVATDRITILSSSR